MISNFNAAKRKRIGVVAVFLAAALLYVITKLYSIQIIDYKEYQRKTIEQYTYDTVVTAKRGIIYDRNMEALAISSTVERVFISPAEIETDEDARLIAANLSKILDVEYDFIYERTQKKNRRDETIKRNVEIDKANEVREFKTKSGIKGIYVTNETKRFYRYSNLASHIIGFTGADNEGRSGIELKYDKELKGVNGRIISAKNAIGKSMPIDYESYIDAKDGSNIVLTIDWQIQSLLEKNLETAYTESQAAQRVTGIIMDPNNGEILAMATKPDFDLNNPYELHESYVKLLEEMIFETEEEEQAKRTEVLYTMWRNKAITDTYEPGSTFKVMTAAMALEEKAVSRDEPFYCAGVHVVAGEPIGCHLTSGHGQVTFAGGLQQSCNPVMMKTAEKLGTATFLKYFDAFGYRDKTGIDLPGEAASITHNPKNFRSVELATHSFGQTFKVTPIQQIVGLAAVANGGKLITPRLVKAIVDGDGNIIKNFETEVKRSVLSEETCKALAEILAEGVATGGAARNAFVKGYDVAAKTGTSQKREDVTDTARIGSCMAFAPANNPQIIVLIIVDEPTIGSIYGGVNSAPYVAKTIEEVLPYLGVEPKYTEDEIAQMQINVIDYRNMEVSNALKLINAEGLSYTVEGTGIFVTDQIPKPGSSLRRGGSVILYTESENRQIESTVPNVIGMTVESANRTIINADLNINILGAENMNSSAVATTQTPAAGEVVPVGTIITVEFRHVAGVTD